MNAMEDTFRMIDDSKISPHTRSSSAGMDMVSDTVEEDNDDKVGGNDTSVITGSRVGSVEGCTDGSGVGAVGIGVGAVGTRYSKKQE